MQSLSPGSGLSPYTSSSATPGPSPSYSSTPLHTSAPYTSTPCTSTPCTPTPGTPQDSRFYNINTSKKKAKSYKA